MVDATRALLDELMGKERNVPLMERSNRELTFSSPEVCKYAIAGLCPYGLFRNTKSDLGACKYEAHDEPSEVEDVNKKWEEMKATWAGLSEHEKARYGYEAELLELLEQLVRDMDRKIERQKERAAKDNAPRIPSATEQAGLDALQAREKELLENSEKLAENGDIDGSLALAKQVEITRAEYEEAHRKATERDRTMTVCDVCGVFMTSTDSEARREEHLAGKQFQGWLSIRKKLDELRQKLGPGGGAALLPGPPPPSLDGRSSRPSEPSRDRDRDRDRDYRRDRDNRDRERDHRGHTSGSRDRDRYHERERGRGGYDERARSPRRRSPVRDRDRDGYRRGDSSGYQRRERDY